MRDRNTLRNALVYEGLSSYLDALTAIDEFTRMIQEDCRAVLERQVIPLQEATGLKFSPKSFADYSEPYKSRAKFWPGQHAWIGTELPVVNSARVYSMDAGLAWNYENGEVSTIFYSSFYTKQLSILNELDSRLRRRCNAQLEIDKTNYGLILWDESPVGADGQYELDRLEKLLLQWVAVWKSAGGVSKAFSNGHKK
jgi:hypothetical protein